ncbi:MAG TPA: helix-turn-helix domain-containing protein, partial [Chloroflexota bacterium]
MELASGDIGEEVAAMDSTAESQPGAQRVEEPVAPPSRLATLEDIAQQLGISVETLRDHARRGELPSELHIGRSLVEIVQPPELQAE